MNSISLGVLSSGALAGAERSGGERSEPQRSAAPAKAGADPVLGSRPDPEVAAKAKRRTFTAEYKLRILQEAEAVADKRGGIGSLLPPLTTKPRSFLNNAKPFSMPPTESIPNASSARHQNQLRFRPRSGSTNRSTQMKMLTKFHEHWSQTH